MGFEVYEKVFMPGVDRQNLGRTSPGPTGKLTAVFGCDAPRCAFGKSQRLTQKPDNRPGPGTYEPLLCLAKLRNVESERPNPSGPKMRRPEVLRPRLDFKTAIIRRENPHDPHHDPHHSVS